MSEIVRAPYVAGNLGGRMLLFCALKKGALRHGEREIFLFNLK